ncbi:Pentatricopeptide repeat-containing protein, chloroplastic, partial [Mucuna pruriens]
MSNLLQLGEDNSMDQSLNVHSEKLAIAFGLVSTASSQPIQIVKNIRICGDYHAFAKLRYTVERSLPLPSFQRREMLVHGLLVSAAIHGV